MNSEGSKSKKALATGVLAAIAASSCCITPMIAAIAGIGGVGATFSWIEPFRPYLIVISILAIGYVWYERYRLKAGDECGCSTEKPKFYQTKGFLIAITVLALVSITFPYYSHIFYRVNPSETTVSSKANITQGSLTIQGMTCASCEHHVNSVLTNSKGVIEAYSSYELGKAKIKYDKTIISIEELASSIEKETGYQVIKTEEYGD